LLVALTTVQHYRADCDIIIISVVVDNDVISDVIDDVITTNPNPNVVVARSEGVA